MRFDEIKPFIVITKPTASQTVFDSFKWPYANSEKVNYTLSEDLREASLTVVSTGGKLDSRSPIEIQLTKDEMKAGSYLESILINSVNLIDSSIYTYTLNGIDSARNVADEYTVSSIHYDITKPVIDLIEPTENGALNAALVTYDFSETMLQTDLTITRIDGTPDTLSPHNVEVVMYELAAGRVDSAIITNAPTLTDGAIYRYEVKGVDLANNASNVIVADNVLFDTLLAQSQAGDQKATMAIVQIRKNPGDVQNILDKFFTPEEPQMTVEEEELIGGGETLPPQGPPPPIFNLLQ